MHVPLGDEQMKAAAAIGNEAAAAAGFLAVEQHAATITSATSAALVQPRRLHLVGEPRLQLVQPYKMTANQRIMIEYAQTSGNYIPIATTVRAEVDAANLRAALNEANGTIWSQRMQIEAMAAKAAEDDNEHVREMKTMQSAMRDQDEELQRIRHFLVVQRDQVRRRNEERHEAHTAELVSLQQRITMLTREVLQLRATLATFAPPE